MNNKDNLGDRMKKYENVNRHYLTRRTPVIIRIDGRAFHTFTKGFRKPYDNLLVCAMIKTMETLCKDVQGCKVGYTQSDEISLFLCDYEKLESSAWFDYNIQKMASIAASTATLYFNRYFNELVVAYCNDFYEKWNTSKEEEIYIDSLNKALQKGAMFDARVFNIPKEDVTNYFLWRQNDATRNSIESVGHVYFSQRDLYKKTCNQIQDMLHEQKNINWNDYPTYFKRGACCVRTDKWVIDTEIPIFKGEEGRLYIERFVDYYACACS